jgi:hypothetical protein
MIFWKMLCRTVPVGCFCATLIAASVSATIIEVPADQPTIQSGINAAQHGDTVRVALGSYNENIRFYGKRIVLTSNYPFSGNIFELEFTHIDGSAALHPDTASAVLFIDGEDARTVIQGFTITGGLGTIWEDEHGAGDYREGGGILAAYSSPTIRDNYIVGNIVDNTTGVVSTGGGGIRAGDGSPRIIRNRFRSNYARYGGAVVLNFPVAAVVRNNVMYSNTNAGAFGGGTLWVNGITASTRVENNVISDNTGVNCGGMASYIGSPTMRNNILWDNTLPQINILNGGPAIISYSIVEGGYTGTGNLDTDPVYSDLDAYYLDPLSPAVDAGDPSPEFNDVEDPGNPGNALYPALGTLRNDMGAYGGPRFDDLDPDGDGVGDMVDNCSDDSNPGQEDADNDGWGDACDDCTDSDGDGYGDPGLPATTCQLDNCPSIPNADQTDTDGDGVGDPCDQCPGFDDALDADADGVPDDCDDCTDTDGDGYGDPGYPANTCLTDNCPGLTNPDQNDSDGDGVGDVCDVCPGFDDYQDGDGDGVADGCDNCPNHPNPGQEDADGDGIGDVCECQCPNQGDVEPDGFVTSLDMAAVIDALFASGDDPQDPDCPTTRFDFDCDGFTTSLDLAIVIDHLFAAGPGPCDPCNE